MRKSIKIARGAQMLGALACVGGIVSCSQRGDPQGMAWMFIVGMVAIVGGKAFEWLTKE